MPVIIGRDAFRLTPAGRELAGPFRQVLVHGQLHVVPEEVHRSVALLLAKVEQLGARLEGLAGQACRVCGCTQEDACEGGCWWVEEDLCSSCHGGAYALEPVALGVDLDVGELLDRWSTAGARAAS